MASTTLRPAGNAARRVPVLPSRNMLLGNMREIQQDPLGFSLEARRRYGDIIRYRIAMFPSYMLMHPDYARQILQDNHSNYGRKVLDYQVLGWIVERGILLSDGELWLRQRRLMQPAFHRRRINAMAAMMAEVAADMADLLAPAAAARCTIEVSRAMAAITMRIASRALFSLDVGAEVETVRSSFKALDAALIKRFRAGLMLPPVLPTAGDRYLRAQRRALNRVVDGIISTRRSGTEQQDDLLQMLLEARDAETGEGMNDDQLRAEVKTLLLAGHETTANALCWIWYLLAQHPDVEAQLHAELDAVLGGRLPEATDLPQLVYTRMVIDEAMRVYPPAWLVGRHAINDDQLGPYRIKAGAGVLVNIYVIHHHPEFWDEPERFDPERFRPGKAEGRHRYAYMPFGGGPHLCIGNSFAQMELTMVLATLAQRYRLRLAPGQPPVEPLALITVQPRDGLPLIIEPRAYVDA